MHVGAASRILPLSSEWVMLEGKPVLKDLDVVKAAGAAQKPLVRELKNVEVQGALDLSFSASANSASRRW